MRLLVTGAAGFIGSHLCERLVAGGHEVIGLDRFSAYYSRERKAAHLENLLGAARFTLHEADLATADLSRLFDGVDGVFHLAAQPGVRLSWGTDFDIYVRDNIVASQRLLEGLKVHSVPAVFASSSSVYGNTARLPAGEADPLNPISPYGVTKLAMERLVAAYSAGDALNVAVLRYFTVFGPRQRPDMAFSRFIDAALAGDEIEILGSGRQSRDFTFVEDAVDATVKALAAPAGSVLNIGSGRPYQLNEVLDTIGSLTGRELRVRRRAVAIGDVAHTWADSAAARQSLRWQPATSLEDGLRAQVEWRTRAMNLSG